MCKSFLIWNNVFLFWTILYDQIWKKFLKFVPDKDADFQSISNKLLSGEMYTLKKRGADVSKLLIPIGLYTQTFTTKAWLNKNLKFMVQLMEVLKFCIIESSRNYFV